MKSDFTVLFLNAGRRVELIRAFRRAFETLGLAGRIVTTDIRGLAPALYEGDVQCLLPHSSAPTFVTRLKELCRREEVGLIVPLIDPDLPVLARQRESIDTTGARVLISPPRAIAVCHDKARAAAFLAEHDIPAPSTLTLEHARDHPLPLFVKPRNGSASVHAMKVETREALEFFAGSVPDLFIQEFAGGDEYTIDVFSDQAGEPLIAVPRHRIKVRSGEVSISRVHRDQGMEDLAMRVTRALGTVGPANVQIMRGDEGDKIIEINPRFGGGCPLSIAAGAPLAEWTLLMALGRPLPEPPARLRDHLTMMRFDHSLFPNSESVSA